MSMEEILKNIYSDSEPFALENNGVAGGGVGGSSAAEGDDGGVMNGSENGWEGMVTGGGGAEGGGSGEPTMTLEDFLAKAGAVSEEDVRVSSVVTMAPPPLSAVAQFAPAACMQNGPTDGRFGVAVAGRVKRRVVLEEAPLDKATQQKQKRMIKNRESAARSRERKQAYTVELESLVTQLEEEQAMLLNEKAELNKARYKQLLENRIPVTEKRRPPRVLRRVCSMSW